MITLADQQSHTAADGSTLVTFTVRIPWREQIGGAMEAERAVQLALNTAGTRIMESVLSRYDTDGEPLERGGAWSTSKGQTPDTCQTLFGHVTLARHLY